MVVIIVTSTIFQKYLSRLFYLFNLSLQLLIIDVFKKTILPTKENTVSQELKKQLLFDS
jgi:hypothetical protein